MLTEPIAVTLLVTDALEALGVRYFIGGSMASAIHGVVRATMDVDLVADLNQDQIIALINTLENEFYIDDEMIRDAIANQSSFNIIHRNTMFKVDVFVTKGEPFDLSQFARSQKIPLTDEADRAAYVASAEDILIAKLHWYRLGGEVSDRQWNDVINVLKVQGERLDRAYLETWADQMGVSDLLHKLFDTMA
jgi:hypothetical protein